MTKHLLYGALIVPWTLAACAPSPEVPAQSNVPPPAAHHLVADPAAAPAPASEAAATADPPAYATKDADVAGLYRWAASHHRELQYIPCACGCESQGHRNLWNCYARSEPTPRRYVWDAHAVGCYTCLEITRQTRRMLEAGQSLTAIRRTIDTEWSPSMDTPRPPEGS